MQKKIVTPIVARYSPAAILVVCALLFFNVMNHVNATKSHQEQPIDVLEGLDPVMLAKGKEVQGDLKIRVDRGRFRYLFASPENKAVFERDPSRYEIQMDGHCARMGAPVTGNPDLYTVHEGRIYIFGSEVCKTRFVAAPEKYLDSTEKPKIPSSPEALKRGRALIEKAVEAMGGASRIDGLSSYRESVVLRQTRRQGDVEARVELTIAFPDRVRIDRRYPEWRDPSVIGHEAVILTPGDDFVITNRGVLPLPPGFRAEEQKILHQTPLSILRARKSEDFKAASMETSLVGETPVEQTAVEFGGENYTLGIDPATGRILSLTYRRRGPEGNYGKFVQTFSDFRPVDSLSLAFKVAASFDDQPWKDRSKDVVAIEVNSNIDPATFARPKKDK